MPKSSRALLLAACGSFALAAAAHAQPTRRVPVDIPAGELGPALNALAQQTKVEVAVGSAVVRGKRTAGVKGSFTPAAALAELLEGSGLELRTASNGSLIVEPSRPQAEAAQGAAGEPTVVEELIVTAEKREERLQDVPVPVTAIQGAALADVGLLRVQDYYSQIPGLAVALSGNGGQPVITIRGITTGGDTNPTAGVVIDDVPYGASVATGSATPPIADLDPGDLARVEVLRGPQGTLYGASSIGGLVKFVTVDPSFSGFHGRVQAGATSVRYGDDPGYSLRGNLNIPMSDTVALRVGAFAVRDPGFVDNAETGERDVDRRDSKGGRLTALWRPTSDFSLRFSAALQDSQRKGTEDVDTELTGRPRQAFLTGTGGYRRRTEAYDATIKGRLGAVEWVSVTGYSVDQVDDSLDLTTLLGGFFSDVAFDNFGVRRVDTKIHNEVKKFSQELRATVPVGERVSWLVGAFFTDESTYRSVDNTAASDDGTPVGTIYGNVFDRAKFHERAAFTNVTVQLTPKWDIQAGLRYGDHEQSFPTVLTGPLATMFFCRDTGAPCDLGVRESSGDAITYLITPRYRVSDDLMFYARLASGYRPGGPNDTCGFPGVPCEYAPDRTWNYDIGTKGRLLDGTLSYDLSLYYIDWRDIQISGILTPGAAFGYIGNVSRAESSGLELSGEYRASRGLRLSGWFAYNKAELTADLPAGQNYVATAGSRLPYSPRYSGNLAIDQDIDLGGSATAFWGARLTYVGERIGNFQPGADRQTYPDYTQLDLRAGMRKGEWELIAFVNNVTDTRGVLRGGLDAAFSPTYFTYTRPRTFGVTIERRF